MSSNCGKCGVKLGVYEYNRIDNEVVCNYCAEGRIRSENPLPEESCWSVVEGFAQLKSVEGKPSNMIKFLFLFTLTGTVLIMIHSLQVPRLSIELIHIPLMAIITATLFYRYLGRQSYTVSGHTLTVTSPRDHSERVIDLRKIERYTLFSARGIYRLTLFTHRGITANIDGYDMKNFREVFTTIKQNLDTINSGRYFMKESTPSGMTVTFADPENVRMEK